MTEVALDTARRYPEKRLVVHYIQPHAPYIGDSADGIPREANLRRARQRALDNELPNMATKVFELLERGDIDRETVYEAYVESLEIAWDSVRELLHKLAGRTVVTADHGEAFGEWSLAKLSRVYAHPPGTPAKVLVEVPWYVDEATERKRTVAETSGDAEGIDGNNVQERLRSLGYME